MSTEIIKHIRKNGPASLHCERDYKSHSLSGGIQNLYGSLYDKADREREERIFYNGNAEPESQLERLANEIKIRVRITAQEIFIIGQLLTDAKKICKENSIGYKDWISDTFDFSYETANNFRNVYKYCFAHLQLAVKLPPSILYKISSPGFPDDLREYLFKESDLTETPNDRLNEYLEKYEEGGIEAVEDEIEELSRAGRIEKQVKYTLDVFENTLRHVDKLHGKMDLNFEGDRDGAIEAKKKAHEKEAAEIEGILYDGVAEAKKIMEEAKEKAEAASVEYAENHM